MNRIEYDTYGEINRQIRVELDGPLDVGLIKG